MVFVDQPAPAFSFKQTLICNVVVVMGKRSGASATRSSGLDHANLTKFMATAVAHSNLPQAPRFYFCRSFLLGCYVPAVLVTWKRA